MAPKVSESPFHCGEQQVQERLGVRDIENWARKVVRGYLPEQHREFHTSIPFLIVSARDTDGRSWVTLLSDQDGFVSSPDPERLTIQSKPVPGDALEGAFKPGADIGILGIELATRRRNRVNGRIESISDEGFVFHVDQSFGNCPQYIREREWRRVDDPGPSKVARNSVLSPDQENWIRNADTFFIGTGYRGDNETPTYGMDTSHRGGGRGFVEVINQKQLRFPDYAGNNHYNTIGNLLRRPQVL